MRITTCECCCRKGEAYADGTVPEFYPLALKALAVSRWRRARQVAIRSVSTGVWKLDDDGRIVDLCGYRPEWYDEPRYFGVHVGGQHILTVRS